MALLLTVAACDGTGPLDPNQLLDPLSGALVGEGTLFEGQVAVVDLERSAIVLSNGVRVEVGVDTEISAEHDVPSLESAAAWLAEGHEIAAWGEGTVSSEDPPVILASALTMRLGALPDEGEESSSSVVEYEGLVLAVNVDLGTLTLDGGATIRVVHNTQVNDDFGIAGLAAAKEHLEAGDTLVAWGHGEVESEEPLVIEAAKLVMKVKAGSDAAFSLVEYEGVVIAVDVEAGTLSLEGGPTIRVVAGTQISDDFGIASLAAAREHLEAGDTLFAWGKGEVESEHPPVIEATRLVMAVKAPAESSSHVEYEGTVVAIDVEAGTLSLEGGATIQVIEETVISDDFGLPSLAAAKEHMDAGASVVAWGKGEVESEEPLVIAALKLVMKVVE